MGTGPTPSKSLHRQWPLGLAVPAELLLTDIVKAAFLAA